jgi:hypothetical protein
MMIAVVGLAKDDDGIYCHTTPAKPCNCLSLCVSHPHSSISVFLAPHISSTAGRNQGILNSTIIHVARRRGGGG